MQELNQEIIDTINAFLTIEEILAFEGLLDTCKTDEERKAKLQGAEKTITEIATKKNLTPEQLYQKTVAFVQKLNAQNPPTN